jgi:CRP/FNR family transcriptional regulator
MLDLGSTTTVAESRNGVPCRDCTLRRCRAFRAFSPEELAFVERFKVGELSLSPGSDLLEAGNNSPHLFTVLDGWAHRYVLLEDGRRQILNFLLPGDLLGLQSSVFEAMQHSVQALTELRVCVFQRSKLWLLYEKQPGLAFDVTWLAAHEESLVDQMLTSVGRRTARERIAFLIVHLHDRLDGLERVRASSFAFPLTQQLIADALGLSLVHTNRTLKRLQAQGLIARTNGRLKICDLAALRRIAGIGDTVPPQRPML